MARRPRVTGAGAARRLAHQALLRRRPARDRRAPGQGPRADARHLRGPPRHAQPCPGRPTRPDQHPGRRDPPRAGDDRLLALAAQRVGTSLLWPTSRGAQFESLAVRRRDSGIEGKRPGRPVDEVHRGGGFRQARGARHTTPVTKHALGAHFVTRGTLASPARQARVAKKDLTPFRSAMATKLSVTLPTYMGGNVTSN